MNNDDILKSELTDMINDIKIDDRGEFEINILKQLLNNTLKINPN